MFTKGQLVKVYGKSGFVVVAAKEFDGVLAYVVRRVGNNAVEYQMTLPANAISAES